MAIFKVAVPPELFAQDTGQPQFQIFADSATKFFIKIVDAQIEFEVGAERKITKLVLHQNGMEIPGTKMD